MPTVTSLVYKVSGLVAYTDGTSGPFEASYGGNDILSSPFQSDSRDNFDELFGDKSTEVNALKALLPGTHTFLFGTTSRSKTVSDWWMEISGRVSYSDGTVGDFAVQYVNGSNNDITGTTGDTHYQAALDNATYILQMRTALRELASTTTLVA